MSKDWYDMMAALIREEMLWVKAHHIKLRMSVSKCKLRELINEKKYKRPC